MSTELALSLPSPVGNLNAYLQAVHSQPLLSPEQERDLVRRFHDEGDLNAAWALVTSHLRFVVALARRYSGYGLPQEDLIQEGNVGLMKAVKRFDPSWGVRLASYAVHWIRAEIHEFIISNWRIAKVATTKAQRKLFFNLRNAKKRLAWLTRDETKSLADDLGVEPEEVTEMERRLYTQDCSFEGSLSDDGDGCLPPSAYLEDWRFEPERNLSEAQWKACAGERLRDALASLDERSRDIVSRRWLQEDDKATLQDLAREYGVSAERIRQIESKAIARLREIVLQ